MGGCYIIHIAGVKELKLPEREASSFEIGPPVCPLKSIKWLTVRRKPKSLRRNMSRADTETQKTLMSSETKAVVQHTTYRNIKSKSDKQKP